MAFRRVQGMRLRRSATLPHGGLLRALVVAALCAAPASSAFADAKSPLDATSSRAAEAAASRSIPWNKLANQDRRIVQYVVRNNSVFRRMPTRVIRCEPEVFTFLVQRPEVVAGVWNVMGVSKLEVERTGEGRFRATDNAGTQGALRVLHSDSGLDANHSLVLYAEGVYEAKPLPRPIKARSILVLQSASTVHTDGQPYVTARLDSFIRFEQASADLIARTLQPLLNRTADHNFTETMKFVSTFSQTRDRNPEGVARLAGRLENVDEEVRAELITLCRATQPANRQASRPAPLLGARR
ncbi:MAG: hypothetical protein AAF589_06100 [Planctomycetota bacterium]